MGSGEPFVGRLEGLCFVEALAGLGEQIEGRGRGCRPPQDGVDIVRGTVRSGAAHAGTSCHDEPPVVACRFGTEWRFGTV